MRATCDDDVEGEVERERGRGYARAQVDDSLINKKNYSAQ
jgi:hypothetical protein